MFINLIAEVPRQTGEVFLLQLHSDEQPSFLFSSDSQQLPTAFLALRCSEVFNSMTS